MRNLTCDCNPFRCYTIPIKEFFPSDDVKGIFLYVTENGKLPFVGNRNDWILLVDRFIKKQDSDKFIIATHSSFSFFNNGIYIKPELTETFIWGTTENHNFYLLSKEQKKYYIKQLTRCGYKFVKSINRLIER